MGRKDNSLGKRIYRTLGSFAVIGASGYIFFSGMHLISGAFLAIALLSIFTPVIIDGGSIIEIILGFFEAFVEGIMGVIDAITNIFNI